MQGIPGQPPIPQPLPPDPGALAMRNASEIGEISTIAAAQMLGGLSGLLVSEGLAKVVRDIMGMSAGEGAPTAAPSAPAAESQAAAPSAGGAAEKEALTDMSAQALKQLVAQGVVGRILALNSLNTYLSLATAEQLRRMGAQLATGGQLPPVPQQPQQVQLPPQGQRLPAYGQVGYPFPGPIQLGR